MTGGADGAAEALENVHRIHDRLAFGSLLLALAVAGAGVSAEAAKRIKDLELTILSTTSNRGEVDPCG